jgi:hypothetical protein
MTHITTQDQLDDLYLEGDIDILFFSFISGPIAYDENNISYGKSDLEILNDTLSLIKFLVQTGDFEVGRMTSGINGVEFLPYPNGFVDFAAGVNKAFEDGGLRCEALLWEFALVKVRKGSSAPARHCQV